MANDISVYKGDDETVNINFQDASGSPVDITGYTIFFTVKEDFDDTDANAKISKTVTTHTDPTAGSTAFTILNTETGSMDTDTYKWDIQWKDTVGSILTLIVGNFKILDDVTDRTS